MKPLQFQLTCLVDGVIWANIGQATKEKSVCRTIYQLYTTELISQVWNGAEKGLWSETVELALKTIQVPEEKIRQIAFGVTTILVEYLFPPENYICCYGTFNIWFSINPAYV